MIFAKNARFMASSTGKNSPPARCLEIAFLGRSNVGKSSLINLLLAANLAHKSATPGKTRLVNFFSLEVLCKNSPALPVVFIDLPGFGYAKVSRAQKQLWAQNLMKFLSTRTSIALFCHLIDARHELEIDAEIPKILAQNLQNPPQILKIFTKIDKISKNQLNLLQKIAPDAVFVSVSRGYKEKSFKKIWDEIFSRVF